MKIRVSYHHITWPLYRQLPGWNSVWGMEQDMEWRGHQFYINKDMPDCDVWVVNNFLFKNEATHCPPENTIFITGEPPVVENYDESLLRQFKWLLTAQTQINHPNKIFAPQGHQWFVGKSYDDLFNNDSVVNEKTQNIAIVTSNLQITAEHKKRYEFVMKLKEYYGDKIQLYGRGFKPFKDKWDILSQYKFCIIMENSSIPFYFTEKLVDCYLALTHPVYYGCTNLEDYFPTQSYTKIDRDDFASAVKIIDELLADTNKKYQQSLPYLKEAKNLCLNRYNFFAIICDLIEKLNLKEGSPKKNISYRVNDNPSLVFRIRRKISNFIYNRLHKKAI